MTGEEVMAGAVSSGARPRGLSEENALKARRLAARHKEQKTLWIPLREGYAREAG